VWRSLLRAFLFAYGGMRAAAAIHGKLLRAVLRARMSFFDNTPLGRILNRSTLDVPLISHSKSRRNRKRQF
jgi:ATP-binding cassette subfamily C (CFTR/MRP) protein 10